MGIEALGLFPRKAVQDYAQRVIAMALAAAAASALIFIAVAIGLAKTTSKPIHQLTLTMQAVSNGRLDVACPEAAGAHQGDEVAILIQQFNKMIARVNELVDSKVEQERNLRYAELKALQAQINPHFIYNTLNSIRSVAKLKGDKELAYISTSLARILREGSAREGSAREGSVSGSDYCSLGHSLDLARDFFTIEDWRWPGRFTMEESVDQSLLDARVPRLIIQPLVENALSHGLEDKPGPGTLAIRAARESGDLLISIADNGVGIDGDKLAAIREDLARTERGAVSLSVELTASDPAGLKGIGDKNGGSSAGIGLLNTHRRLRLIYGEGYGLTIISAPGAGTNVTIRIPYASMEDTPC
jgi:two-component system sensor histidine kinase YesM